MNHALDLLDAFQQHYSTNEYQLKYTLRQRQELVDAYAWMSRDYKRVLYDEVIRSHRSSLRSLPDMAVIKAAEKTLDRPEVYETPAPAIEDKTETVHEAIDEQIAQRKRRDGEINHWNRERLREKVRKGEATKEEHYWIWCIDEHGGDWKRAWSDHATFERLARG